MADTKRELLDSIIGLCRAIHAETGRFTTYSEGMHAEGGLGINVSIYTGESFEWFRGADRPITGHETSIEQMRDDLAAWLVKARKEVA